LEVIDLEELKTQLRSFILDNFLFGDSSRPFGDGDSLLGRGIIDSTGVLELINYLQDTFQIQVDDNELVPDNLDSIDNLALFLSRKFTVPQA
jgi:acyl carrier protein